MSKVQELAEQLSYRSDLIAADRERILREGLKTLLDRWRLFKPLVWESSFAEKDYEHTKFTRALIALAEEIESLAGR